MSEPSARIRPRPGWALLYSLKPNTSVGETDLVYPVDLDGDKTAEGVFRVVAVNPSRLEDGTLLHPDFEEGDLVLCRDYLKYANSVGHLIGADARHRYGLVNVLDVLAVVSGKGTIGLYDEYRIG